MASKINYNNKAPFQTLEEIPDENKVNANDMNEIKTVVNNNADELNTAKEDIEGLQNGQGTASTDITSLKNRTTALETDNTTNKQNIQNLQTDNEINKTNITNLQNSKVDKVEGKNLSTNDFTNEYKQKLDNLSNYDDTEVKADIAELEEKVSTLEEDNTTNKTNIEALQEDNTQNKSDISDLQESQEEQDAEIGILMNALPSETQEGENINIQGTIPVKFKEFVLKGNSKQDNSDTMPSPEYPSEIQNVKGDVNVTVCNKNLYELDGKSISKNGVNYIVEKGIVTAERSSEASSGSYFNTNRVKIPAGTYVISGIDTSFVYEKARIEVYISDKESGGTAERITTLLSTRLSYEYTSDKPFYISFTVVVTGKSDVGEIFVFKPQVEVGSMATDYEQHQEQVVTFPLSEGQKLYLGDYLADDGIHHAKKQIELDGTENVLTPTNLGNVTRFLIYMKIEAGSYVNEEGQLSSHFKYLRNFTQDSEHFYIENDAGSIYLFTNSRTANDVNSLKAFLSTQKQAGTPVVVEYKLAEEEIEPYTEIQQEAYNQLLKLKSYEGATNVYSTNETSPIFKVTAVKDINSVITQLNQLILENRGN